jgi:hypothetical protein
MALILKVMLLRGGIIMSKFLFLMLTSVMAVIVVRLVVRASIVVMIGRHMRDLNRMQGSIGAG